MLASFTQPPGDELPEGLMQEVLHVTAEDGHQIPLWRYKPKSYSGPGPAALHIHGGGYICLSAASSAISQRQFALISGVQIFSVDYRLAPEHPYPTPLHDCWACLQYIIANATDLGVDVSRIGVVGESAGGGLAAAMTLLARDRNLNPPLARQFLTFPMLDDRNKEVVEKGQFALWKEDDNLTGWTAYLGSLKVGSPEVPIFAAPDRVSDVSGLPPLYMEVGQLDLFMKENFDYVGKFIKADIEVEFHVYPGLPHGWAIASKEHTATVSCFMNRVRQLKLL
jgi:acetyl esterase/lipase